MELFNPEVAVQSLGPLFAGLMLTVLLTMIVIVLALVLGLGVALARLYGGPSPLTGSSPPMSQVATTQLSGDSSP